MVCGQSRHKIGREIVGQRRQQIMFGGINQAGQPFDQRLIEEVAAAFGLRVARHVARQRAEQVEHILFAVDAFVEQDNRAPIRIAPQQPPEALLETDRHERKNVVVEFVAFALRHIFLARLKDGIEEVGVGQLFHDDEREGFARYVYAFPKALETEQHRFEARLEFVLQLAARPAITLFVDGDALCRQMRLDTPEHVFHAFAGGEEAERPPAGEVEQQL